MAEFFKKVQKTETCWNWTARRDKDGYGIVKTAKFRDTSAHRVSWILKYGKIPKNMQVLHKCDNRSCVKPFHLFLGSNADNSKDMVSKGRQAKGEKFPQAKLSWKKVEKIRKTYANGKYSQNKIAMRYGVSQTLISKIVLMKNWVKNMGNR